MNLAAGDEPGTDLVIGSRPSAAIPGGPGVDLTVFEVAALKRTQARQFALHARIGGDQCGPADQERPR